MTKRNFQRIKTRLISSMLLSVLVIEVNAATTFTGQSSPEELLLMSGLGASNPDDGAKALKPTSPRALFLAGQYPQAFEKAKELADQGDGEGWYVLGLAYESGNGAARSIEKALESYAKASELNNKEALYRRALLLLSSGNKNLADEAKVLLEKAASDDLAVAGRFLGEAYLAGKFGDNPDAFKAMEWWKKSSEQGDVTSMMLLGALHQGKFGHEAHVDLKQATDHYRKAASIGHVPAMLGLGSLLLNGDKTIQNKSRGRYWLEKAVAKNSPEAHLVLGDYEEFVDKDSAAAVAHYEKGAKLGEVTCMLRVAGMYINGNGVEKNGDKAVEYLQQAARLGNLDAHFSLAQLILSAKEPNLMVGYLHMLTAAQGGLLVAQNELAVIYLTGRMGHPDETAAISWFTRAAKAGNASAQHNLGTLYEAGGAGVDVNLANAVELYTLSAKQGYLESAMALADLLSREIGGQRKDPALAWAWASLAAESGDEKAKELLKTVTSRCSKDQLAAGKEKLKAIRAGE